jgi:hypothetical protein
VTRKLLVPADLGGNKIVNLGNGSAASDAAAFGQIPATPPGAQLAAFPGNSVTGTSLADLATFTVPANDPVAGAVYEIEAWGNGSQGSSRQTLQIGTALGSTAMSSLTWGTVAFQASATFRWWAVARVICLSPGASASWVSLVRGMVAQFNANLAPTNANESSGCSSEAQGGTTYTISSLANQTLRLQAAWGATGSSPSLTTTVACCRRIA